MIRSPCSEALGDTRTDYGEISNTIIKCREARLFTVIMMNNTLRDRGFKRIYVDRKIASQSTKIWTLHPNSGDMGTNVGQICRASTTTRRATTRRSTARRHEERMGRGFLITRFRVGLQNWIWVH